MAKSALAGQMKTRITVKALRAGIDTDGFQTAEWIELFSAPLYCLWVNAHGTEVFEGLRLDLKEVATVTTRYTPLIDPECRIWHEKDIAVINAESDVQKKADLENKLAYDIISIDNVEDGRKFLELKIKRVVVA